MFDRQARLDTTGKPLILGSVRVDLDHRWVERDGDRDRLTSLEAELLRYLAEADRIVTRDELLERVWNYSGTVLSRACDSAVRRLRTKIEDDPSNPQFLLTVHGSGYRLVREAPRPAEASPAPPPERAGARRHPLGEATLDLDRVQVERPGGAVPLTGKEVAILEVLVAAGGASVDTRHLQRKVWGSTEGRALHSTIVRLRRKLEPDPSAPRFLRTTAGGYRLDLGQGPLEPVPVPLTWLPSEMDRRFGREDEIAQILAHFAAGDRLVTMIGPGGVGKTRLALCVARALPRARWVDATEARSLDALYTSIALALEAQVPGGDPLDHLARVLAADLSAESGDGVLVLDNLEQIGGASVAVSGLLERAPRLRILATSRVVLQTRGERRVVVQPLSQDDAVALFVDRAVRPPEPDELPEIRALVESLDRLPLAIELAAARTGVLSVAAIRARTGERLKLLATPDPLRPERYRSLRASLDGSWELARPWTRAALAQLTVFEGVTVDAAEAILDLSAWPEAAWTIDVLQDLVDTSLLRVDPDGRRFTLLEVVREYAAEHLSEADRAAIEVRHGRYYARPADGPGEWKGLDGLPEQPWAAAELPNVRVALDRAIARNDPEIAVAALEAAFCVWFTTGPMTAALHEADRVRAIALEPAHRARTEWLAGRFRTYTGDLKAAELHLQAALALARETEQPFVEAEALYGIATLHHRGSRFEDARRVGEDARAVAHRIGHWGTEIRALVTIGGAFQEQLALDRAEEHFHLAHQLAIDHGSIRMVAHAQRRLGFTALMRGRLEQALEQLEAARSAAIDVGDLALQAWLFLDLAEVHRSSGRVDLAAAHAAVAVERLGRLGDRLGVGIALHACAWDRLNLGQLDGLDAMLDRALLAFRACGSTLNVHLVSSTLGVLALERAQLEQAEDWFRQALAVAQATGTRRSQADYRANLGRVACLKGARDAGLAELDAAIAAHRALGESHKLGDALVLQADGLTDADRLEEAERSAREAVALGERLDASVANRARRALAVIAVRRGDRATAERSLAEVREGGLPSHQAGVLHAVAELAWARGDTDAARAAVEAAAARVDPAVLGARFRALRAAVGGPPPDHGTPGRIER